MIWQNCLCMWTMWCAIDLAELPVSGVSDLAELTVCGGQCVSDLAELTICGQCAIDLM